MLRTLARATAGLALASRLFAQAQAPAVPPDALHSQGRDVTMRLLTMGTGEAVWEMFGHSAIWIHNNVSARDTIFDWGEFDSTKPYFIPHFLQGLMMYRMGGSTLDQNLQRYRYWNRTVWSQELDLSAAQKDSLLHMIQVNAQPENITYRYNYFLNNCSTRPRDMLDQVLGGQLHERASETMPTSYRWHALRLMQGNRLLVLGVDIGLGEPSDKPVTRWDEMFLPREVHDFIKTLQVRDSTGAMRPLVRNEQVLFQATRPDEPKSPPNLAPWLLCIGVIAAALFAVLGWFAAAGSRGARVAAALLFAVWSLLAGLLGVVLTMLWTVTDHTFAHANENVLLFNPVWLLLAVLLPMYVVKGRAAKLTRALTVGVAGLGVVALLAHVVRLSPQANLAIIGLALPPALVLAWLTSAVSFTRREGQSPDRRG